MKKLFLAALALAALSAPVAAGGDCCAPGMAHAEGAKNACCPIQVTEAVAVLHPTAGNQVSGVVRFSEANGKVTVVADLKGLTPNTTHGFHIHEFGDCTAPDATSAGGHYNPTKDPHAGPTAEHRHAGDLGNVTSDAQGNVHYEITVDNISLCGMKAPILGRGVIVHAKADDLKSQPTGDAGGRVACGVIGVAGPKK